MNYKWQTLDKYKPVLLLSAVILIIVIGYYAVITAETPVVNLGALDVEVVTDDTIYLLGQEIELSVYLYNDRLRDVQVEDAGFTVFSYYTHEKSTTSIRSIEGSPMNNPSLLTVPAKSRILYGRTTFKAKVTGWFIIECLGEKITLKIVFHHEDSNL